MTPFPALSFDEVRKIGSQWDPIGVPLPADEYDEYLLEAVFMFRSGLSVSDVASFLVEVETIHMRQENADCHERAHAAAAALKAYLDGLPSSPG